MVHQRGMWPKIEALVRERAGEGLVLEGSAILPGETAILGFPGVAVVWLTSSDAVRRHRIEAASGYAAKDAAARYAIDRFIERNRRLDAHLRAEAERLALPLIDVDGKSSVAEVAAACLATYSPET